MRPWLLLFFFWISIPVCISAQQLNARSGPSPATNDTEAIALLRRSLAALTGGAQVTDVTVTGSVRRIVGSDDENGTATLMANSAGDSRTALSFPSGNRVEVRNHAGTPAIGLPPGVSQSDLPEGLVRKATASSQAVGTWSGPDGISHAIARHNLFSEAAWFSPAIILSRLISNQNDVVAANLGEETYRGQTVLQVSVSQQSQQAPQRISNILEHLSRTDVLLDQSTLLPTAVTFNTHPDSNAALDIPVEVYFSDYHNVNGVQVPLHVQRFLNGSLVLDLQLGNATINSGLASNAFQTP
jgi:hypothetical protein